MTRNDVLSLVRGYMMLDGQQEPRGTFGRARSMSANYMMDTLDLNGPQWRKIKGLEEE